MASSDPHDLERRVADLEQKVRLLESRLDVEHADVPARTDAPLAGPPSSDLPERAPIPPVSGPKRSPAQKSGAAAARPEALEAIRKVLRSEDLINKVGIFLLLIGMAFLFKWGIDRGWITPTVRVAFGGILGLGMVGFGGRIRPRRHRFGQVLVGGGIAVLYITLFSAYQLYSLLSYPAALLLMTVVTALSFGLSLRQSDVILAIIATAGGLGTPFLLFEGPSSILWLVVYTCVITACAVAIFFERGWRTLLFVTVAGAWSVMTYTWSEITNIGFVPVADRAVYQIGVVILLAAFGFVPAVREVAAALSPDRWSVPVMRSRLNGILVERPALWLTVLAPLVSLALSHEIWDLSPTAWGAVEVVAATGYWAVYLFVRTTDYPRIASAYGVAAALVLAVSWFHLFEDGSLRLLALALQATALHVATYVSPDKALRAVGHGLFVVVAAWMLTRLTESVDVPSLVSGRSVAHIGVLCLGVASSVLIRSERAASTYRVVAALLLAAAWFTFFADGSNRFLALSLQAAALILLTQYLEDGALRTTAHGLFLIALLAIDWRLTSLDAGTPPLVNGVALVDLAVIIVAVGCSLLLRERYARLVYRFAAYLAFLAWFWRDLAPIENGHAVISLAWGGIAVLLIMMGWRSGRGVVRITGLATLGVVVLKLFVIDLAELEMGWRVVLFIGLGALLLGTSYLFPSIWKGDSGQLGEPDDSGGGTADTMS